MIGVGGSVKAVHALGAGRSDLAGQWFSLTTVLAAGMIGGLTLACFLFLDPLLRLLNSDPGLHSPPQKHTWDVFWPSIPQ